MGYRYSPGAFLGRGGHPDPRATYISGSIETTFDRRLFWRVDPQGAPVLNAQGLRGALASAERDPLVTLIVAVGDANTLGPSQPYHWPGDLEDLLGINGDATRHFSVVNAGVPGYSSFQGVRRFEQLVTHRPDLAYFSFGWDDADTVDSPDVEFAGRLDRLAWLDWLRFGPPLAHLAWRARRSLEEPGSATRRVPLSAYRANLERFVELSRASRITPVLLTRPFLESVEEPIPPSRRVEPYNAIVREVAAARKVPLVDVTQAFAGRDELFVGPSRFSRLGCRRMAELLLDHLHGTGSVKTTHRYASTVEPGMIGDHRLELRSGFFEATLWAGRDPGRWTTATSEVILERRGDEGGVELVLFFFHPEDRTRLRVEANGRPLGTLEGGNGEVRRLLDIRRIADAEITLRLISETPYVPGPEDPRRLGVFVRQLALVRSSFAPSVRLAELDDARRELGPGWFEPETWGSGPGGRWTGPSAVLTLGRRDTERQLVLETSGNHPDGEVTVELALNGRTLSPLRVPNELVRHVVDIGADGASDVEIRFAVKRPIVPARSAPGTTDRRTLGIFVHAAQLASDADP